ncbi:MAG: hypothetical protein M1820_005531 [Bogoriella megaspora]|nr:MAG: hypothetical protein M1820_005531 [Bogoriella megaspora]
MKRQTKTQASSGKAASLGSSFGFTSGFATSSSLSFATEPPDLTLISDTNIVVAFKNLAKKDGTTKAKALEELHAYTKAKEETKSDIEDGILQAWSKVYPRLSIDSDRRVRQLSHTFQGRLSIACGKRTATYLPKVAASWLAGLYDTDKATVRATQESLKLVFSTPQKLHNLRKIYQGHIVEHCRDAILNETAQTLSDERSVSPDDAEAKYVRVVSSSVMLVSGLIADMDVTEIAKHQPVYDELYHREDFWKLAYHEDSSVRRSMYRFLRVCLEKTPDSLSQNLNTISACFLVKGLGADQTGSSVDFVESLTALTASYPTVWTQHFHSKKPASARLHAFLSRGSRGAGSHFWYLLQHFIDELPIIPRDLEGAVDLLRALQNGITSKDEPRTGVEAGWMTYIQTSEQLLSRLPADSQSEFLTELVLPFVTQYIRPDAARSQWTLPNSLNSVDLLDKIVRLLGKTLETEWPKISSSLIDDMKASMPEQSKGFENSQDALASQGERFASIQEKALANASDQANFIRQSSHAIEEAIDILKSRNGRPYGVASMIESVLRQASDLLFRDVHLREIISNFLSNDVPGIIIALSPSATQLIRFLATCKSIPASQVALQNSLYGLMKNASSTEEKSKEPLLSAIQQLLDRSGAFGHNLADDAELQSFLVEQYNTSLNDVQSSDKSTLLPRLLKSRADVVSRDTIDEVLAHLTESLTIHDQAQQAVQSLEQLHASNKPRIEQYIASAGGSTLVSNLLLLSESTDEELADEASSLSASLMTTAGPSSQPVVLSIISKGLNEVSPNSVSVQNLSELAERLLTDSQNDMSSIAKRIVPTASLPNATLAPYLAIPSLYDTAITSPLAGALYLVSFSLPKTLETEWDAYGLSKPLRLAMFLRELFARTSVFDCIHRDEQTNLLIFLELVVLLAEEDITTAGSRKLFAFDTEDEVLHFISEARYLVRTWLQTSKEWWVQAEHKESSSFVGSAIQILFDSSTGDSPSGYCHALAYTSLVRELVELHGPPKLLGGRTLEANLDGLRKGHSKYTRNPNECELCLRSIDTIQRVAFLEAMQTSLAASEKALLNMVNTAIAVLTDLDPVQESTEGVSQLVTLNATLQNDSALLEKVAKQRVVFLVKHILPWTKDDSILGAIRAEALRALLVLLPRMKDTYGPYWAEVIETLHQLWASKPPLPILNTSLRLFAALRTLSEDSEANDDLVDAWKDMKRESGESLVSVLKGRSLDDVRDTQPQRIVDELLARQIAKTPLQNYEDLDELFPLILAQSESVQRTAFSILDVQIPARQEQISFDAALDKKDARLPDELLSLILEVPSAADLQEEDFKRQMPQSLRGYLLSWLLVFDHFKNSSYKVRSDYTENLKEGGYLNALLDLASYLLQHSSGKPIDASKFDIKNYDPDLESEPIRDTQWLLIHLFYLSLTHLPLLTKSWWIELRSRQKITSIGAWSEKYICPLIIESVLDSVSKWDSAQDSSEERLTIKVKPRTREVTASYLIDDLTLAIAVRLPDAYPLQQARVEGISRVVVDDRKWQSWLRNCQGVIAFSNGSIPDGLNAFHKNVLGALKGQTECAICYSIIGEDKQLPSKKCGTCKNLFHSSCLFKWFKSSNQSTCPLCRNPFNYG